MNTSPDLAEQIKDMPVFIVHGDADTTVRSRRVARYRGEDEVARYEIPRTLKVPGGSHTDYHHEKP